MSVLLYENAEFAGYLSKEKEGEKKTHINTSSLQEAKIKQQKEKLTVVVKYVHSFIR
jgi:hypothetical protein